MHEEHLACIEENPLLMSTYGIKSRSKLNKLTFFNTVSQQPFDTSHEIFEGIAVDVITDIRYFIREKYFTINQFNAVF